MGDDAINYHIMVAMCRNQPSDKTEKIQQVISAVRTLPYDQEVIIAAIAMLGAGLAAGKKLEEINL